MHRTALVLLSLLAVASAQDVNSLMQQAQQLATSTLNQAQDTLNQAAAASGNSDVQNAIQQSKDIIKDTQNAVNNGSIFGNTTFNTNVGNSFMTNFSADWTNSLAALQQWYTKFGANASKVDFGKLGDRLQPTLATAYNGYYLLNYGVNLLTTTKDANSSIYLTLLNTTNDYLGIALQGFNKSIDELLTGKSKQAFDDSVKFVKDQVNITNKALLDPTNDKQVRNLAWTYILVGYAELYNASVTIGNDCDALQALITQYFGGNFTSYLYYDLIAVAAAADAVDGALQTVYSNNGDSLSSNSVGGQTLPAGCDADLKDGWTAADLQAWFKSCGSNIDAVIQYYASLWDNTDNDLSSNIATIDFDWTSDGKDWTFKCGN